MAQVILDSSSSDDEDGHLLVDWKSKTAVCASDRKSPKKPRTTPSNVICLDSDSDKSPEKTKTTTRKVSEKSFHAAACGSGLPAGRESSPPQQKPAQEPSKQQQKRSEESRKRKLEENEAEKLQRQEERAARKQEKEELKRQHQEEKKKRKEAEKLQRAEVREKAAAARKLEQEREKWEKGKFSLENTIAVIDCKVVEHGLIGGQLLSRFGEKDVKYRLGSNPIPQSVMWRTKRVSEPAEELSQELQLEEVDVPYLLFVFEAEEFSDLISRASLDSHVRAAQRRYPGFTLCYVVNKLHWYIHKRDQEQYKRGESSWVRPNADKCLAEMLTNYTGVHSRMCLDEAEVADHIVALTRSLAESPFKKPLSSLFVSKNGDHIVNNDPNKEVIKKSGWLKALVAIPKVSGAMAIAISSKYPTFRSLLNAYMDSSLTVHEKELLLEDLQRGGGQQWRRVGPACSRRVYRILMAQNGDLKTEDVEVGADHFDD